MSLSSDGEPEKKKRRLSVDDSGNDRHLSSNYESSVEPAIRDDKQSSEVTVSSLAISQNGAQNQGYGRLLPGSLDVTGTIVPALAKRGPGRPRKVRDPENTQTLSTIASEKRSSKKLQSPQGREQRETSIDSKPKGVLLNGDLVDARIRRRSGRVQSLEQSEATEVKHSALSSDVVDTRKRHANGKPMGRPRNSDLIKVETLDTQPVKLEIPDSSSVPRAKSHGESHSAIDIRKRSATGKPLGRPRKSDIKIEDKAADTLTELGALNSPKTVNQHHKSRSTRVTKALDTYIGPKKIKLRFGLQPSTPVITSPAHIAQGTKHLSFAAYLDSFVSLDEDVSPEVATQRRASLREIKQKVAQARAQGLLEAAEKPKLTDLRAIEPEVVRCHQDYLCGQAKYFSKLMQDERKRNFSNARKIAGMIQAHFKRLLSADERQTQEDQKFLRQLAKRTSNEIRRKWRLAEKEVQRRVNEKYQEEQRAAGKEHLNQILERSTSLLDAQFSSKFDDESFSDKISEGNEDHYLSVEELRHKYANIPDVPVDRSEERSDNDSNSDDNDDDDDDESLQDDRATGIVEGDQVGLLSSSHNARNGSITTQPSLQESSQAESDGDSPMDSELDSSEGSEADSDSSDAPGLAALYPELTVQRQTQVSEVGDESYSDRLAIDESIQNLTTPEDASHTYPSRNATTELTALPSDVSVSDYDDDDSPMDSELDDSGSAESGSDIDNGPGLSWLYSTPLPKAEITHAPDESAEVAHTSPGDSLEYEVEVEVTDASVKTIKTPVPFLLRGILREYQHIGLDWMAGLYLNGTNGILADEMGLGKTIQTISLLTWLACEREVWGPHLIVVPTSVMLNWEREFKKFAPALKVLTYYGTPKERKEKRKGWSRPDAVHVVITSYQLVITDAAVFRRKYWEYMILDEAHNIKNFKSQRWQTLLNFNTAHRLLLTGTPLQNNLNELWSLLYFLMPQGLSDNASFANLSDFQEWFARPVDKLIEQGNAMINDEARHTIAKLHRILRPYILRRLKADVEKQMPGKYEHVITCRLSKRQRFLYDDFMARSGTRAIMASGNFLSIINCFMQLRKVCNHPDLFESRPIVTSFAARRSVVANFEIQDLLIRRRLFNETDNKNVDLKFLNLNVAYSEHLSKPIATRISELSKPMSVPSNGNNEGEQAPDANSSPVAQRESSLCASRHAKDVAATEHQNYISTLRCARVPLYGQSFIQQIGSIASKNSSFSTYWETTSAVKSLLPTFDDALQYVQPAVARFACITPKAITLDSTELALPLSPDHKSQLRFSTGDASYFTRVPTAIAFPDKRLLQFDCGKLQRLDNLLKELIAGDHRILIFTQMTKMLDILEQFLNIHGYRYFRLDGSTKIEARQSLTERFNNDKRIPVFILSTRSGGLGINLTGADTVIFYDSDWNPCMDRQCQDRAHRIGQTRDVHIYRFVSEYTIEQNIMRKANQKRMLDNVVIGEGDFTTDFFNKVDWRDMLGDELAATVSPSAGIDVQKALAAAEDEDDARAALVAEKEMDIDAIEFAETGTPGNVPQVNEMNVDSELQDEIEIGSVDDYMISFLAREMDVSI
ncbi:SNF2 family helicase Swr1 [Taphrina deformans PYCC 5710]|uniref:DNA helicase n=1 Tax=Taphrina deformans (strain PYCC 5710 / ATCC 11124 / CBS 356.35 / IMI 108563 / JCM 9778 / NBRC 8474) TaxID=1097556 RepID=R4XA73_TAPDE|nr:SNF2 family helicase Swr1 [Taphrina deformans PYCC 5710]|eukprot:CCG82698.1 SNF2 family helicase Swr1 [Taphrina deformans PYCC 5710]